MQFASSITGCRDIAEKGRDCLSRKTFRSILFLQFYQKGNSIKSNHIQVMIKSITFNLGDFEMSLVC